MTTKPKFNKIVLLHAWDSDPTKAFFPWLKKELENHDLQVIAPTFPNAENPDVNEWLVEFNKLNVDAKTLVVGRSLGGTLALATAMRGNKIGKLVSVCTTLNNDAIPKFFEQIGEWDFTNIKENIQEAIIFQSTNDPYVPREMALKISEELSAPLIEIENAEHFAGTQYPEILEEIKNSLY